MIADRLLQRLAELEASDRPTRYLVAFSGGIDSTVLLHALWSAQDRHRTPLVAVHVNHALQADAAHWQAHCERFAAGLGVELLARTIEVPAADPRGPEAAARALRYAELSRLVGAGDHLLTAHHQDDQAETLLLNLMRGSGVDGLAGIGARQPFGRGILLRPLLGVARADIEAYAASQELQWCEDPSNLDRRFDRNLLRREILPLLHRRWPAAAARLARSAELLAESSRLLAELAELDLAAAGGNPARLSATGLQGLSPARQRNLLRHAIRRLGLPSAPATRLEQILRELVGARRDASPLVRWPGAEVRRYRQHVYVLPRVDRAVDPALPRLRADGRALPLGRSLGSLVLEETGAGGIDPRLAREGLSVGSRKGGEKIRPAGRGHAHALGKLMQEAGLVPWMREFLPLLHADGRLVAVADLWVAEESWRTPGFAVRWIDKPPLY